MTLDYLKQLLDFHYWARDIALAAAEPLTKEEYERGLGSSFPSVRDTLNHMLHAEWVWYWRWQGTSHSSMPEMDLPDVAALRRHWAEYESKVRAFVNAQDDSGVARVYDYATFAGKPASSKFWEMVVHLVNHGSYHRGQVTTMLRQLGAKPPESTDMVRFFRARAS